jgi:hypothetical protein
MNKDILDAFDAFQVTDLDDDMAGMCKALVDWMKLIRTQVPAESLPPAEPPTRFYKMNPHQPKMELRKNLRKMMAHACKYQQEEDETVRILNVYVVVLAAGYLYHMPTELLVQASQSDEEFTREMAEKILLDDGMSPNWLKEPSGKDFTAIML